MVMLRGRKIVDVPEGDGMSIEHGEEEGVSPSSGNFNFVPHDISNDDDDVNGDVHE